MELIKAQKKHIAEIVKINQALKHRELSNLEVDWDNPSYIFEHLDDYWVICDQDKVLAAVSLIAEKDFLEIYTLAVATEMRQFGLGRILIALAESQALLQRKKYLLVESFCVYQARGFYESCGFELCGTKRSYGHRYYSMRKQIRPKRLRRIMRSA